MNTKKEIKISSNWTNIALYGGGLIVLLMFPVLYFVIQGQELHMGMAISGIVLLILVVFLIYEFMYVCDARIKDNKLVLKKQFRPAKSYTFDKIGEPSSFQIKKTKYVAVQMENNDNSKEKYVILNSVSIFSFENKDSEETLNDLRKSVNRVN